MSQRPAPQLPQSLRGTAVLSKAFEIFSQNFILCVPGIIGILAAGVILVPVFAIAVLSAFGSADPLAAMRRGVTVGAFAGVFVTIISYLVAGWLTAMSSQVLRTGKAEIGGASIDAVVRKAGRIVAVWFIVLLAESPFLVVFLGWVLSQPLDTITSSASYIELVYGIPYAVIGVFLIFLIPLLILTDFSVKDSFSNSFSLAAKTLSDDQSYLLAILAIDLGILLISHVPVVGAFVSLIASIVWQPIRVLSALIYLKVKFNIPQSSMGTANAPQALSGT